MDKVFTQVTGEDGTISYVEVSAEELDGLVKGSPEYQRVVKESMKRKEKIKALTTPKPEEEEEDDVNTSALGTTPVKPNVKPVEPVDVEALKRSVYEQVRADLKAEREAAETREKTIAQLLEDNGLSAEDRVFVENASDPKAAAEYLGQRVRVFETGSVAPRTETERRNLSRAIEERMGLPAEEAGGGEGV